RNDAPRRSGRDHLPGVERAAQRDQCRRGARDLLRDRLDLSRRTQVITLFLSSFLVLFLEIALIRWMPAYIRLLAYFSNFILLATFLGGGLGCVLARGRRLIVWF